jgi:biotin carboxylase
MSESFCGDCIIEEFIEGEEFSCESISYKGKHKILAITKKFTTGSPYYVEIGHIQPANVPIQTIQDVVFRGLDAIGLENGASHTEFKITLDNRIVIIEIGARMAGDYIGSHLVQYTTGIDYVGLVLNIALGHQVNFDNVIPSCNNHVYAIRFICSYEDIQLYRLIKMMYYNHIVLEHIPHDDTLIQDIHSSGDRYGWFIIRMDKYGDIINLLFEGA